MINKPSGCHFDTCVIAKELQQTKEENARLKEKITELTWKAREAKGLVKEMENERQ